MIRSELARLRTPVQSTRGKKMGIWKGKSTLMSGRVLAKKILYQAQSQLTSKNEDYEGNN